MKRFTATEKWDDPWFRKLSPTAKLLWFYVLDKCDAAGVIELDVEDAEFRIGAKVGRDHVTELASRFQSLPGGKLLVKKFITFQNVQLSAQCPAHKPVFAAIARHSLEQKGNEFVHPNGELHENGSDPVPARPETIYPPESRVLVHYLNEKTGAGFRESSASLDPIAARLKEHGVTLEGCKQMIDRQCARWKLDPKMAEYLRPTTLFNKTKFNEYYAVKDLPVDAGSGAGLLGLNQPSKMTDAEKVRAAL